MYASQDIVYNQALADMSSPSLSPSSSPQLLPPVAISPCVESPPLPPPSSPPAPRVVRRLTLEIQQTDDSRPPLSPSRESNVCPVLEEALASPAVYCSQYRMEELERQLPGNEKVVDWFRDVQAAHASDGPSSPSAERLPYPTPPAAPRKDQYVTDSESEFELPRRRRRRSPPAALLRNGQLFVHKEYEGRLPLCYYATGLHEGGSHDVYMCYDARDILWARRVRYHNERERD